MIANESGLLFSAQDLLRWRHCGHASALDAAVQWDGRLAEWRREQRAMAESRAQFPDPAIARGLAHERDVLDGLRSQGLFVADLGDTTGDVDSLPAAVAATVDAMRRGADVVYQAALVDAPWMGYADFLVKVAGRRSRFGDFAYAVADTKLARHATADALIQTAHYGAMLAALQQAEPAGLAIWLGTGSRFDWPYRDAAGYLLELRRRFLAFHSQPQATGPEPVAACPKCPWLARCEEEWGEWDLKNVHRLSRRQRRQLREHGIATMEELADASDELRPGRIGAGTFDRLRAQATAQLGPEEFVLTRPQPARTGIAGTPPPHELDVFFDLEGDPYCGVENLDYLWAFCDSHGNYHHRWAHTPEEEFEALKWLMEQLRERENLGGGWKVYHYGTYELTSMRRVAARAPDAGARRAAMVEVERLIGERFDDLYRRVELGLRTRDGSTSLKIVERLAGYDRDANPAPVAAGDDSIGVYEAYLASDAEAERVRLLEGIRHYNEHDVRATLATHRWLFDLGQALGPGDLEQEDEQQWEPSEAVLARRDRSSELRGRLLAAADQAESAGRVLGSGLTPTGARILAEMLHWHKRESSVAYQDFLRLCQWAQDPSDPDPPWPPAWSGDAQAGTGVQPGTEHERCLLDIVGPIETVEPTQPRKRAKLYLYQCRPGAWKIRAGSVVRQAVPGPDGQRKQLDLVDHDAVDGSFSFERTAPLPDEGPLVEYAGIRDEKVWEAIADLGERALAPDPDGSARAAIALLDRVPPMSAPEMAVVGGESPSQRARRLVSESAPWEGVLPVQGPPGTGKTRLAVELIIDEITGARSCGEQTVVAVSATAHKVIDNVLRQVVSGLRANGGDGSRGANAAVVVGHVGSAGDVDVACGIERVSSGGVAATWIEAVLGGGASVVLGGTKFVWCRPELRSRANLLVIDEAGQVALADGLAMMNAAARVVALGDPQQLASPIQAAHDEAGRASVLEQLARGRAVLPDDVGVFLDTSHRMHPAVCAVVADLAYEGRLLASDAAAARDITGPALAVAGIQLECRPGVAWLPVVGGGDAETEAVAELIGQLTSSATVKPGSGSGEPLGPDEILVVAPHNSHVNRIAAAIASTGVRVGTVDRFQGQQAHVVIYTLGRLAEQAGDVGFLYELNRLNVALSRARLMAIVVADPDATFPPVQTPEQLRLASRFDAAIQHSGVGLGMA